MTADVIAVLNPISGGGVARTRWAAVAEELARRDVSTEVVESTSGTDARGRAEEAAASGALTVAVGGVCDDTEGYFVRPTVLVSDDPTDEVDGKPIGAVLVGETRADDRTSAAAMEDRKREGYF